MPTFDEDVAFMRRYATVELLENGSGQTAAVCAEWQGRVMTSAAEPRGPSLGFVDRAFIEAGVRGTPFDNYGGEDRLWLGPEAGQYGFFFAPGARFDYPHWQVPRDLQEGAWPIARRQPDTITFARTLALTNHSGLAFDVGVERRISLLSAPEVQARFGVALQPGLRWVAFETVNAVKNVGSRAWQEATGLLSVWVIGQFPSSPSTWVVIPLARGETPAVNDRYFGDLSAARLVLREKEGFLRFKADGRYRSKIGVDPRRALPLMASLDAEAGRVTLVHYTKPERARGYVNSLWETQAEPYGGDVINSYNDGPPDGSEWPRGTFYELESSSPAAALAPGESLVHTHATLHLAVDPSASPSLLARALGLSPDALR